jgi:hypothetical protein
VQPDFSLKKSWKHRYTEFGIQTYQSQNKPCMLTS